jgi:hypothetical protein
MTACLPEACAFRRATRNVEQVQEKLLRNLLWRNRHSEFGCRHAFDRLRGAADYRAAVPVSSFADFAPAVQYIAAGRPAVLTAEPVELLEPTSGTTAAEKWVPYTATLRRQFRRAVAAWVGDLFWHRPAVRRGRAYWSISPAFPWRLTSGGIPIGFDDDTAYLGGLTRPLVRRVLVTPEAPWGNSLEDFRVATLAALLAAPDLALLSVWSPTFLTALLELLDGRRDEVFGKLPPAHRRRVERLFSTPLPRAEQLRRAWPRLALISCWTDAAAGRLLGPLTGLFPHVEVQPKGLLATEGCVSFPLVGRPGAALAIRSHFFEFAEAGGPVRLARQVDRGGRYGVVLTTGGGLYRYRLGDEVEVVGFEARCPLLRFVGKEDRISDLVGEKLAEPHVREVLDRAAAARGLSLAFVLLAPQDGRPPGYVLYVQGLEVAPGDPRLAAFVADVEAGLEGNPHYRHAVGLGQLRPLTVAVLSGPPGAAWGVYEQFCLRRGQKAGAIKPTALDDSPGWAARFAPLQVCDRTPTACPLHPGPNR